VSSLLELSKDLAGLSAAELRKLLLKSASAASGCNDLLDLSRLLLSRRELEIRIRSLSATEIKNLRESRPSKTLKALALAGQHVFEEAAQLARELEPINHKPSQLHGNALSAYETMLCITELLFACERHWLGVIRAGIRSQDAKEIALKLKITAKEVQQRFQLAMRAGLVAEQHERWVATEAGLEWLELDRQQAWLVLAAGVWSLPKIAFQPGNVVAQLRAEYPLLDLGTLPILEFGAFLGLLDGEEVRPPLLEKDLDKISKAVIRELPKAEERLIVQGDLSIICPGPLSPQLHRQLDSFAESEDLGLAARFRISNLTLSHALEIGMELAEVEKVLVKLSGKQLPQPVQYLFEEVKRRFGLLKVLVGETGTVVESSDTILITQIANESKLTGLMLKPIASGQLASRLDAELIYFNLRDAGYQAVMFAAGKVISPRFRNFQAAPEKTGDELLELCEKLLSGTNVEMQENDVLRQLQFALKNKLLVKLRVELQDGSEQEFELAPLGISANRLRGKDTEAEAERTLPISRIRGVLLV
jgi:hypothetical protein